MEEVVIVSAVRTAIGRFGGALAALPATQLGSIVIESALNRVNLPKTDIDEVIMGNVLSTGLGQNPARQAAIGAALPDYIPAFTVNKVCGSGLKSVALAAQAIQVGQANTIVAGGMENMSSVPYMLNAASRWGQRLGDQVVTDLILKDGLMCAFNHYHMGVTAENIATQFDISRAAQDIWALNSQQKAAAAMAANVFKQEIIPVHINTKRGEIIFDTDEHPRDTTLQALATLPAAFKKEGGTVTPGNAAGINDGAAALILMSAKYAQAQGIKPLAKIISYASAGVDPALMGMGPVTATQQALDKAHLTISDIDLIEINEAFAAQYLAVEKMLGFKSDIANIYGGAIALGHPIGASGARILVTLIHAMLSRQARLGLATLCIGGGQGIAMIIESIF